MKVILLKDVARIGQKYEVKNVPDGHALNYLMPRGLAEAANAQNLKNLEKRKGKVEAEREAAAREFDALLTKQKNEPLTLKAEANDKGHLFKGIHAKEIAAALGTPVTPEMVVLPAPIKQVGEHTVMLAMGEHKGEITLTVEAA